MSARLETIALPDFGMPDATPELPADIYPERLGRLRQRMEERGYDRLLVYADREHSANISYLTGFDPRFEEALLVIAPTEAPAILVGNECWGTAGAAPLPMRRHMFQDFSLPSQPRDRSRPLSEIVAAERIGRGSRVGLVGWKSYADAASSDVPAYIVDALRTVTGGPEHVENATDLLINAADGMRVINEVEQLAMIEWAACQTSQGVRRLLLGLRSGMTEHEARGTPRLERRPALVSPDAHGRTTRALWPAQPFGSADPARRSLHDSLRDLGSPELPRRVDRRGCGGTAGWNR